MKDGITTNSGNSRYLKSVENFLNIYPNYEAFANALIAGTLPVDLNGINPAGWQQLGTILSKANLLSDETESAIFGNSADRTVSQALAGLDRAANKLKLMAKYTVAGAYEWTCPEDGEYIALIIGGGGSGAVSVRSDNTAYPVIGGASGFVNIARKNYSKDEVINLVVGAGGESKQTSLGSIKRGDGVDGGSSSFDSFIANGGGKGVYSTTSTSTAISGAKGAQPSSSSSNSSSDSPPFGGIAVTDVSNKTVFGTPIFSVFLDEHGLPVSMLCAGGNDKESGDVPLANGKKLSPGLYSSVELTADMIVTSPTDCGAGGGSCRASNCGTGSYVAKSGKGADGGVFIYKVQGGTAA